MCDQLFIDDLTKDLKQNLCQACVLDTKRVRAKPRSSDSKSGLIYILVFANFLCSWCMFCCTFCSSFPSSPHLTSPSLNSPFTIYPCWRFPKCV